MKLSMQKMVRYAAYGNMGSRTQLQSVTADTFKENAFTWFQINVHVVCAVQIRIKTFGGMNCRQNEKKLEIV